ncbi:hypothetical protein JKF63_06889 [Porcisia hertigi]|uniref:Dynein heavy chain coiled coil stalk domain-containing protein n=1 Tax=Porcisia hertigi TaxID=2761500 RepID=A0A836LJB2_9TRYP|nr:hypothetical protein JKF63_06889 [Porcisia hertigi]
MELCEAAEVSSELRVGSIIAYKCLEAEGATTSWQVGTVLALPSSSDNNVAAGGTVTGCKNFKSAKDEAKVSESSPQRGDRADDSADDAKQHVATAVANPPSEPASVCQGLLVQPWVSLSSGAAGGGSGSNRSSPSLQGYVRTPTARFTEMSSMHMYLKKDKRFTTDGDVDVGVLSLSPASGTSSRLKSAVKDDDEDNRRFAGELSLACPRRLSFISQSKACRSPRSDDLHGSDEDSHAGVDGEGDAELGSHQIEERLVQLDRRIDEVLSDVQRTRQRQRELEEMQKAAKHSLRSAERLFRDAQKKVQCIDKRHLCELQSYRVPPMMVRLVMHAVLFVLGERAMSWADVVAAMRNPSFISNVVSFDPAQLSPAKVKELKKTFISNPRFSHADALQGSHALGQFHDWVMRQVQLIEAGSTDSKVAAGQVEIRNALAVARKRMKEDVALLQHLEERVEALMCEHARLLEVRPASMRSAWTLDSKTSSSGHPSPFTNVLARSFDSQGRTAPDQPGFDLLPIQSVSGAEPPALLTTPRCTPVAELGEATETRHTPAVLSGSGAQQPARTFVTGVAAPTGGASALHIGVDQKMITGDTAVTNDRIEGVYHHPSAALLADGQHWRSSVPPGNQWMCPQPAVLPCTYVPRSNILCVFGHQQLHPSEKLRETTSDQSTATPAPHWRFPTPPQSLGPENLSGTPQQVSPLSGTPSLAAALQTEALPVNLATHHTEQFAGEDWGDVVTRSPAEVHQAALEEERTRHAKELKEAQTAAAARAEQQLQAVARCPGGP